MCILCILRQYNVLFAFQNEFSITFLSLFDSLCILFWSGTATSVHITFSPQLLLIFSRLLSDFLRWLTTFPNYGKFATPYLLYCSFSVLLLHVLYFQLSNHRWPRDACWKSHHHVSRLLLMFPRLLSDPSQILVDQSCFLWLRRCEAVRHWFWKASTSKLTGLSIRTKTPRHPQFVHRPLIWQWFWRDWQKNVMFLVETKLPMGQLPFSQSGVSGNWRTDGAAPRYCYRQARSMCYPYCIPVIDVVRTWKDVKINRSEGCPSGMIVLQGFTSLILEVHGCCKYCTIERLLHRINLHWVGSRYTSF